MPRATILVVEDNPSSRKVLRLALEVEGYAVVEATDGGSALAYLDRAQPDLVIQDLVLPDVDGLELTKQIRAMSTGKTVPIVIVSGFVGRLEEARAIRDEYVDVLVKPVTPSKLVETVRAHLTPGSAKARAGDHGKRVLLVDDSPSQLKLDVVRFEEAHFHVTTAASAEQALAVIGDAKPDVVVTDVLMPGIDGFELCSVIRRSEPTAHIPVILISALQAEGDIFRAKQIGASGLLPRGPGSEDVIDAAFEAIAAGPPRVPTEALRVGRGEHAQRLIQRLERFVTVQAGLEQRYAVQSAELALLGAIADALTRSADADVTLRDIFAATLDAAGISSGALFLTDDDGTLVLRHSLGYELADGAAEFFGESALLANAVESTVPLSIPSAAVSGTVTRALLATAKVASMQIVPIVLDGKGVGALVLGSRANDLPSEGVIAFARAIGSQIVQSLALVRAFEQRKLAEAALLRANEELERRVQVRTSELERSVQRHRDMLAFVSHDLRNPLSTMCLGAEQLGATSVVGDLTPMTARIVERMRRVAVHMRTLIDGLVDFASIEDGSLSVEPRIISVRTLVDDAMDLNAPIAAAKGIKLELAEILEGRVSCDPERIRQVFSNLIGNAIKFSKPGAVVSLDVKSVEGACEISITDRGCGIRPEHLEHVFDRYWHLPGEGRRGTGLGLAIAKGIVEAHGGRLHVDSELGKGSCFRFTLTFTAKIALARQEGAPVDAGKLPRRVLVVDDDPFLRLSVAELLAGAGFIVYQACDGADALGVLASQTADLILLDQKMPNMSGDEFLHARELDAVVSRIPVVMLSATTSTLLHGVAALVKKPFTSAGLLDAIHLHCSPRPLL
jgi:CheY-like chemotaxis protein